MLKNELLTNRVLAQEKYRVAGLHLEEDEDFVYLKKDGKVLARFSGTGVTFTELLHEADQQLNWMKSGIEFNCQGKIR